MVLITEHKLNTDAASMLSIKDPNARRTNFFYQLCWDEKKAIESVTQTSHSRRAAVVVAGVRTSSRQSGSVMFGAGHILKGWTGYTLAGWHLRLCGQLRG